MATIKLDLSHTSVAHDAFPLLRRRLFFFLVAMGSAIFNWP